jgi:ketosteroid isomerase-like protein
MKKILTMFFLFAAAYSYPQNNNTKDLTNAINNWTEGFNAGNFDKAISIYSSDFIGYYPDQPDQTLNDIKEQYKHIFSDKNLSVKILYKADEIKLMGKFAYVRMTLTATIKPAYAPNQIQASDKGLQVWQKDNAGLWKLIRSSSFPITKQKK